MNDEENDEWVTIKLPLWPLRITYQSRQNYDKLQDMDVKKRLPIAFAGHANDSMRKRGTNENQREKIIVITVYVFYSS